MYFLEGSLRGDNGGDLEKRGEVRVDVIEEVEADGAEEFVEFDDGESEDVLVAAVVSGDEEAAGSVDGVGAGAVDGIDNVDEAVDFGVGEGAEGDVGGFGAFGGLAGLGIDDGEAGDNLVGVAGEAAEHGAGFGLIGGFGEDVFVKEDEGVGGDDNGVMREFAGDVVAFCAGVGFNDGGGYGAVVDFGGVAGDHLEFEAERGEQCAAARGSGSEYEGYHGVFCASSGAGGARSFTCTEEGFSSGMDTLKRSASG